MFRHDFLGEAEFASASFPPSLWRPVSPAARRSPCSRTARCATRADSLRARKRLRLSPRTARSSGRALSARAPSPSSPCEISSSTCLRERERRDHAGAVAAVNAGLFDVLHDRADDRVSPSAMQSTSTSIASSRKRSTSTGRSGADFDRALHVTREDRRRCKPAPWRGRRARTTAAPARDSRSLSAIATASSALTAVPLGVWRKPSLSSIAANSFRSSAISMLSGCVPMIGTPAALQAVRQIERRLPAELHDHAFRLFLVVNVEHVLERERLEVEFVARVVIGRNRFRIRVHHDGFEAELAQREGGVHAAVIEFDSLPDPVRPAAENHDLALVAPRASRSRRRRWNSNRACMLRTPPRRCRPGDRWESRRRLCVRRGSRDSVDSAARPPICRSEKPSFLARRRSESVRELSPARSTICLMLCRNQRSIFVSSKTSSIDMPSWNAWREVENRARHSGSRVSGAAFRHRPRFSLPSPHKPKRLISSERSAFCSASLNVRPIAIASPTLFICVVSVGVGLRKFLEGEARNLDHAVIDRRLETRRRFARDVVADFVERVTDRQFRGDFRDRESGRLRRQRATSARRAGSSRSRPSGRSRGLTANWMFDPPVSTPISRMTANEASRII